MKKLLAVMTLMCMTGLSYAAPIPYCTHNGEQPANATENTLLQKLIPEFGKEMGCKIGTNCLGKWNNQENPTKFSIAWAKQCGPVIGGMYQLGNEGHGSTFTCQKNSQTGKTCCSPLGYDYVSKWVVCSKSKLDAIDHSEGIKPKPGDEIILPEYLGHFHLPIVFWAVRK